MKIVIRLMILAIIGVPAVFAVGAEISGVVINTSKENIVSQTGPTIQPFDEAHRQGETIQEYIAASTYHISVTNSNALIYQNTNGSQGCAFLFSADATGYDVVAAPLGSSADCRVNVTNATGFTKRNVLLVNVSS